MKSDLDAILGLEVPVIVVIGERRMRLNEVTAWIPGTIIELQKSWEDELQLLVNNKPIGTGTAVKVGENFGIKVSFIGNVQDRIKALGAPEANENELDAMAEAMLAGM